MSDNINKTYDISNVEGPIVLRDSFGNRTYYDNATSAMAANPGNYYIPMSSNGLKNYQVLLPSVYVVGYKPDYKEDDLKTQTDPVRNRIFQGYYNGRKFEPTSENISHYLKLYENDKKVNEGYGWHLWGKLAAITAAGAAGAGALAVAAPLVGSGLYSVATNPFTHQLLGLAAGGMATHMTANELYKGITGSNQGYMADAADFIADQYEGSKLQDFLNEGGIYLPGSREDFKTVMLYADPAAFTSKPLNLMFNTVYKVAENPKMLLEAGLKLINTVKETPEIVANIGLTVKETPKRFIETAMRTTSAENPIKPIIRGIGNMAIGRHGGPDRLLNIGNYILTGRRIGPKGYYNSFSIDESPSLGSALGIKNVDDFAYGYSGFYAESPTEGVDDIVDAFLYGKTIDPRTGLKRVDNNDFEILTDYVNKNYPKKKSKILVYETRPLEWLTEFTDISKPMGTNSDTEIFETINNVAPDVGGHMYQKAIDLNNNFYQRGVDIWKFLPKDYIKKWNLSTLLYPFVKAVDNAGTPIIFKTPWTPLIP